MSHSVDENGRTNVPCAPRVCVCIYWSRPSLMKINRQKIDLTKHIYWLPGTEMRARHTRQPSALLSNFFIFIIFIFHFAQHDRCRGRILLFCYIIVRLQFLPHINSVRVESLHVNVHVCAVCMRRLTRPNTKTLLLRSLRLVLRRMLLTRT